jgi:hypothetical protein
MIASAIRVGASALPIGIKPLFGCRGSALGQRGQFHPSACDLKEQLSGLRLITLLSRPQRLDGTLSDMVSHALDDSRFSPCPIGRIRLVQRGAEDAKRCGPPIRKVEPKLAMCACETPLGYSTFNACQFSIKSGPARVNESPGSSSGPSDEGRTWARPSRRCRFHNRVSFRDLDVSGQRGRQ